MTFLEDATQFEGCICHTIKFNTTLFCQSMNCSISCRVSIQLGRWSLWCEYKYSLEQTASTVEACKCYRNTCYFTSHQLASYPCPLLEQLQLSLCYFYMTQVGLEEDWRKKKLLAHLNRGICSCLDKTGRVKLRRWINPVVGRHFFGKSRFIKTDGKYERSHDKRSSEIVQEEKREWGR